MHVILAAGGTGGHLFPALALCQAFQRFGHHVTFVGSGRELDFHVEKLSGLKWHHLKAGRLKGMGWASKLKSFIMLPLALFQALIILVQEKPDLVLGLGGYSTGPMVLMARVVGIRAAILEQNGIPGFTNRILAWFANRIFVAFPSVTQYWHKKRKIRVTGNPVRQEVISQFQMTQKSNHRLTLLTFGGSQGAHFLNETMLDLLPRFSERADEVAIIHITGQKEFENVLAVYKQYPQLKAQVMPFSDEMGRFYKEADLVMSRAGAATISDLMHFGRASVLIPYPYAADRHQDANAHHLSDAGAALLMEQDSFDTDLFWKRFEVWLSDRSLLSDMADRARALAPEAPAERIIQECLQLL